MKILHFIKSWMLPIAMVLGSFFHEFFSSLSFLTPWLIFIMLILTYSKIKIKDIKITKQHIYLLAFQIIGSIVVYSIFFKFNTILAESLMICIFIPTAVASSVVVGILGGNVTKTTTYIIISSVAVALLSPFIFSYIGNSTYLPFWKSFLFIALEIFPILVMPLFIAYIADKYFNKTYLQIKKISGLSYYIWALSLTIVTAKTVDEIISTERNNYLLEIIILLSTFILCILQFKIGRKIGETGNDKIGAGQSLGQKNTILGIWLAHIYLNPISSIGPASYVLWQNLTNSFLIWKSKR